MSRNNKVLTEEKPELHSDNQIRLDINKFRKKEREIGIEDMQISQGHPILEKLVLLALPSPSRHVH